MRASYERLHVPQHSQRAPARAMTPAKPSEKAPWRCHDRRRLRQQVVLHRPPPSSVSSRTRRRKQNFERSPQRREDFPASSPPIDGIIPAERTPKTCKQLEAHSMPSRPFWSAGCGLLYYRINSSNSPKATARLAEAIESEIRLA